MQKENFIKFCVPVHKFCVWTARKQALIKPALQKGKKRKANSRVNTNSGGTGTDALPGWKSLKSSQQITETGLCSHISQKEREPTAAAVPTQIQ